MDLFTFNEALDDAEKCKYKHILLGNGFSIACRPSIFSYGKLFEQADFSKISGTSRLAFEAFETEDFEKVIKVLRDSSKIITAYRGSLALAADLTADANGIRELLVQAIAASHPAWPGELTEQEYQACSNFLANFKTIYTLNYDLLLYWVLLYAAEGKAFSSDDGFRKPEDNFDAAYVVWEPGQSHEQNTWFLHGALHVFDTGVEVQKYTWKNTGVRLIDQIRDALEKNFFPIFVSEGTSSEKYERIRHNDYLAKAYRSFSSITGALFIYGHSLADNDEHYLRCIQKGKISRLYVAIYGDPNSDNNKLIMRRADHLSTHRGNKKNPLIISYFDASTAKIWGK